MKRALLLLVAFGSLMGFGAPVRAESDNDFTLVNKTGYVLDKIYVSPNDTKEWGEDIMGKETVADGEEVKITFHPKAEATIYDLKVVYDDKTEVIWQDLKLPEINKLTIHWDAKEQKTSAEVE